MNHEEVLNALLADSCSNPVEPVALENLDLPVESGSWNEYYIQLHCSSWLIVARPIGDLKFEIRSMQKQ